MRTEWGPIAEVAQAVRSGKLLAVENVNRALQNIEAVIEYNAVIHVLAESASTRARYIDELVSEGKDAGALAGVPFIAKDNFLVFGGDTTAASNILRGFEAPYQATAIERLEAEGAICVAKANLDAFAHGGSTENSDFGVTLNPHDSSRVAGGSSGGSAAVVALNVVPFALGTDTGGSIREPASFCGVVGYKPTYGLVSRYGVVAMASSTDVIGPIATRTEDVAIVLDVLAGKDERDATTIDRDDSYVVAQSTKKYRIGVVKEFLGDGVSAEVQDAIQVRLKELKKAGHDVIEVSIPSIESALACYYVIVPAEISSNLSRYDGQRYGFSASDKDDLNDHYSSTRGTGFNPENKRRILIGTYVLSSGYYDAYYKKAALVRTKLISELNSAFESVDFLIGPTAPEIAPKVGQNTADPLSMYMLDIMTVPVNLCGVPAISLPVGHGGDMPIGMQIIAPMKQDKALLAFAHQIEKGTK